MNPFFFALMSQIPQVPLCQEVEIHCPQSECTILISASQETESTPWIAECFQADTLDIQVQADHSGNQTMDFHLPLKTGLRHLMYLNPYAIATRFPWDVRQRYSWNVSWAYNGNSYGHVQSQIHLTKELLWEFQWKSTAISNTMRWQTQLPLHLQTGLAWAKESGNTFKGTRLGFLAQTSYGGKIFHWQHLALLWSHSRIRIPPFSRRGPALELANQFSINFPNWSLEFSVDFYLNTYRSLRIFPVNNILPTIGIQWDGFQNIAIQASLQRIDDKTQPQLKLQYFKYLKAPVQIFKIPKPTRHALAFVAEAHPQEAMQKSQKIPTVKEWQNWLNQLPTSLKHCANQRSEVLSPGLEHAKTFPQTAPPNDSSSCELTPFDWTNNPHPNTKAYFRHWFPIQLP